jgi:hypothetical protein
MHSRKVASISGSRPEVGSSSSSSSGDERDLLPVAPGVGARLLGRVQGEPLDERLAAFRVQAAAQPAQQVDDLTAGQAGPQRHVAGHVGQPAVQAHRVVPRVPAEQAGLAGVLLQQAEQDADRRGLARAVRAEEGVHLAGAHGQVQAVQGPGPAERLVQGADLDRGRHGTSFRWTGPARE